MPGTVQQHQQSFAQAIVPVYDPTFMYGMHGYVPSVPVFQGNGVGTPFPGLSFWSSWSRKAEEPKASSPKAAPAGLQRFPSVKLPEDPLNDLTEMLFSEPPTLKSQPSLKALKQQQLPTKRQHQIPHSPASSGVNTPLSSSPVGLHFWPGYTDISA